MSNFISWVPVISIVVGFVGTVITIVKTVPEAKNLRRRNVKELLDLIDEAGNRFKKESANSWRNPDGKPPKGSFEDSLAKDLLVSQIFGRTITWSDWIEIRKFLTDYENVRFDLLRYAWLYRDQTQTPPHMFPNDVAHPFVRPVVPLFCQGNATVVLLRAYACADLL
jgi:hypothetical protein